MSRLNLSSPGGVVSGENVEVGRLLFTGLGTMGLVDMSVAPSSVTDRKVVVGDTARSGKALILFKSPVPKEMSTTVESFPSTEELSVSPNEASGEEGRF